MYIVSRETKRYCNLCIKLKISTKIIGAQTIKLPYSIDFLKKTVEVLVFLN